MGYADGTFFCLFFSFIRLDSQVGCLFLCLLVYNGEERPRKTFYFSISILLCIVLCTVLALYCFVDKQSVQLIWLKNF